MREYGEGSFWLRGTTWWVRFYVNGERVSESTKAKKQADAVKYLRRRLGEIGTGKFIGKDAEKVTFEDLMELVRKNYVAKGNTSLRDVESAVKRLAGTFAGCRAMQIKAHHLTDYFDRRRAGVGRGHAHATVNYELATLRRGFRLAVAQERLPSMPVFTLTDPKNARKGFFEDHQFEAVCKELPPHLVAVATFAKLTGWRKQDFLRLTWDRIDFKAGIIRLDVGTTKNADGRTFPMDALPELLALLKAQRSYTDVLEEVEGHTIPWVFHHRGGRQIKDYYGMWRTACKKAGLKGMIMHDFRRTAARNLERASVARSVSTKLTGHKTEAIFRRYAIVNEADLREGVVKLARSKQAQIKHNG